MPPPPWLNPAPKARRAHPVVASAPQPMQPLHLPPWPLRRLSPPHRRSKASSPGSRACSALAAPPQHPHRWQRLRQPPHRQRLKPLAVANPAAKAATVKAVAAVAVVMATVTVSAKVHRVTATAKAAPAKAVAAVVNARPKAAHPATQSAAPRAKAVTVAATDVVKAVKAAVAAATASHAT